MKFYESLKFRTIVAMIVVMAAIFFVTYRTCTVSMRNLQYRLTEERLDADITHLEDIMGDGSWHLENQKDLYCGDIYLGDGTLETANIKIFTDFEDKTGTFVYTFRVDDQRILGHVEGGENVIGWDEGHYLRVAGSTLDPNGNSIVGTYMTKNVSDILDEQGYYGGEANVAGGMIYCVYRVLEDPDGNIVGAIVAGRGIDALRENIRTQILVMILILSVIFAIAFGALFLLMRDITNRIGAMSEYIGRIDMNHLPEQELVLKGGGEFTELANGINTMTNGLRENVRLRKEAETDPLTGINNRLGWSRVVKELVESKDTEGIAVGIIDIDYFKQYNDNYGHQLGDSCIQSVAGILKDLCKEKEDIFCARYGGDEFTIIARNKSGEELKSLAAGIKDRIHALHIEHKYSKAADFVTLSMGFFASSLENERNYNKIMHNADIALYEVKAQSRDGFRIFLESGDRCERYQG